MYTDPSGLIVQSDGDGGDCLQREGFFYQGVNLNKGFSIPPNVASYKKALNLLCIDNQFVRYPILYNDPKDTSRDQLVSNIRALAYYKPILRAYLDLILKSVIKNYSRYPNNDIAFIQDYSRFIRSYRFYLGYPIVLLGDLFLLGNSIVRIIKGKNYDDVGDDINHIGDLAQAQNFLPTPISWLARKLYKKFRPTFNGFKDGPTYALNWYFRKESGANTDFITLWEPIVDKF